MKIAVTQVISGQIVQRDSNPKFNTVIFVTQGYMSRIIDDMGSSIMLVTK